MAVDPVELVGYCGSFCGKCGICGTVIGTRWQAVGNVLEAAGFRREAEHLGWPLMRGIATQCCAEFERQAAAFGELTERLFPSHCREGCVPPCQIAQCCRAKGLTTCAECGDLEACALLPETSTPTRQNLAAIAAEGLSAWAERQFTEAREAEREKLVAAVSLAFETPTGPDVEGASG